MTESPRRRLPPPRVYQLRLPPWAGLVLLLPLGLLAISVVTALVIAALAAGLLLPFFLRRRLRPERRESNTIELSPEDYRRID